MTVTFLGTGTSHGVPCIDCMVNNYERCPKDICRKSITNPKHRRTRCSILVECGENRILVDVSPDFREQVLRQRVLSIDAVLITHEHADHIGGIPDIRSYTKEPGPALPMYGSVESMNGVRGSFGYIFDPDTVVGGGIPRIALNGIDGPFNLFGTLVTPIRVTHGGAQGCFGYRIGSIAYIPDMKTIAESEEAKLHGLDVLIVNCLRIEREHSTHLLLSQSMALARRVAPKKCVFVHMCHDIDYEADSSLLDAWMMFGFDGLQVSI